VELILNEFEEIGHDDEMIEIFTSQLEHASELDIDQYEEIETDDISDTSELLTAMDWNDVEMEVLQYNDADSIAKSTVESQISLDWREYNEIENNKYFKMMIIVDW
jgi:uncharacterized protein YecA (UPF0149 family)